MKKYIVYYNITDSKGSWFWNMEIESKKKIKTFDDFRILTDDIKKYKWNDNVIITNIQRLPI